MKKAISAATSAALLASLLATAVAPSAFAATTTAGVGSVGRGSTSTATATFTFTEETTACVFNALGGAGGPNGPIDLNVLIAPKAPITGTVQFVGTPTLVAPGSLGGATATIVQSAAGVNDTLRIRIFGGDQFNKQQITVSGLKVKASSSATLGAIQTTLTSTDGNVLAACFIGATDTASGTVSAATGIGATSVVVAVASGAFVATGTLTGTTAAGKLVFATGESVNITGVTAVAAGFQTLTIAATTVVHPANEAVTQANVPSTVTFPYKMASVGTVTDSVRQDVWVPGGGLPVGGAGALTQPAASANPGEQNQAVNSTYIYERGPDATTGSVGFIAKGTVLTFTLNPSSGVLFSTSPSVKAFNAFTLAGITPATAITAATNATEMTLSGQAANGVAVCTISFDRKSCSITVTAASVTRPAAISLFNIMVDVDSTVANGTPININVTGVPVAVDFNTVAYVSRVIVGVAAQPTIFINYNDQASGMMSLTEAGAGFFQDASVTLGNNVFAVCATSGETFTRAPWAVVSTGDLKLLSGLVGATSVQGTLFSPVAGATCAYWTVFSASTVASTVDIRGSDSANAVLAAGALNGPRYSVGPTLSPGATLVSILVGDKTNVLAMSPSTVVSKVSNAVRAFKSGVTVTALTQPFIPQGTPDSLGGNLQISETLAGQFKAGEQICVAILPRATNSVRTQDTLLKTATTNDLPIITTNGATGLLVSSVATAGCSFQGDGFFSSLFGFPVNLTNSFSFTISQQAFGTLGQITIANIHYITTADAPLGSVLVAVAGAGGDTAQSVQFQTIVSNAKIGTAPAAVAVSAAGTALGATKTGAFTTSTKVAKLGKYVTWKFAGGSALAGKTVQIWVATKNSAGRWSAFALKTARVADASGNAYFWWKTSTKAWISVRGGYLGSLSQALQARWL
jgi:hypothetical protein